MSEAEETRPRSEAEIIELLRTEGDFTRNLPTSRGSAAYAPHRAGVTFLMT